MLKGKAARLPVVTKVGDGEFTVGKKTYVIEEGAVITVDGKKADASAIRVGMRCLVNGKVIARGKTTAESLYGASRITARTR